MTSENRKILEDIYALAKKDREEGERCGRCGRCAFRKECDADLVDWARALEADDLRQYVEEQATQTKAEA